MYMLYINTQSRRFQSKNMEGQHIPSNVSRSSRRTTCFCLLPSSRCSNLHFPQHLIVRLTLREGEPADTGEQHARTVAALQPIRLPATVATPQRFIIQVSYVISNVVVVSAKVLRMTVLFLFLLGRHFSGLLCARSCQLHVTGLSEVIGDNKL